MHDFSCTNPDDMSYEAVLSQIPHNKLRGMT